MAVAMLTGCSKIQRLWSFFIRVQENRIPGASDSRNRRVYYRSSACNGPRVGTVRAFLSIWMLSTFEFADGGQNGNAGVPIERTVSAEAAIGLVITSATMALDGRNTANSETGAHQPFISRTRHLIYRMRATPCRLGNATFRPNRQKVTDGN